MLCPYFSFELSTDALKELERISGMELFEFKFFCFISSSLIRMDSISSFFSSDTYNS